MKYLVFTFLLLCGLLSSTLVNAEHIELSWTNATTRVDGSAFDAETDLASIEIGCGISVSGPFDAFTASVLNLSGIPAPTMYLTDEAPIGLQGCVAFSVDRHGLVSGPSNIARAVYRSPVEALKDLQTRCYGGCPGTVQFNFTVTQP